ncbi:hypothetical protein [Serratia sp. UGAL515B_01]|uniref:hypothetical protein n=1 Tax=Serratia sp. UGAL515B_01 TaxID=2986763 RepID=UPI0029557C34|nr:hypothetical protein [Serratia sp. UGAL515B_01]WON77847.1 hypothetical protein OK023_03955 [Serratia sp. UGAL515B_01]
MKFLLVIMIPLATVSCGGTFFPEKPEAWENGRCYKKASDTTCKRVTDTMEDNDWDFLKTIK